MLLNIAALIVVLGVLILLHEGGHFLAARAVGAPVSVFSFGFGKRLFGFRRRGTDFRVSLIPLGGYVRVEGLGPDESDLVGVERPATPLLARWQRAVILVAGPAANIFGAIAFLAAAFVVGVPVPAWHQEPPVIAWVDPSSPAAESGLAAGDHVLAVDGRPITTWRQLELATISAANRPLTVTFQRGGEVRQVVLTPRPETRYEVGYAGLAPPLPAVVAGVVPKSPAEKAGLAPGDTILAVDGHPVENFYNLVKLISERPGREVTLTVARDSQALSLVATTRDEGGRGILGVPAPNPTVVRRLGVGAAVGEAVRECRRMTHETFSVLGRMVTGRSSLRQMSGPIDIARFSGAAARTGAISLVWLLGVISLQLAIFNLLPIPVLDGGHLAVIAIETAARRDLPARVKERILNVGFWMIVVLVAVVLVNDVIKNLP